MGNVSGKPLDPGNGKFLSSKSNSVKGPHHRPLLLATVTVTIFSPWISTLALRFNLDVLLLDTQRLPHFYIGAFQVETHLDSQSQNIGI